MLYNVVLVFAVQKGESAICVHIFSLYGFPPHLGPLEKEMATHSSILAWKIPRTEKPGGAIVHGVTKSQTRLNMLVYYYTTEGWEFCKGEMRRSMLGKSLEYEAGWPERIWIFQKTTLKREE